MRHSQELRVRLIREGLYGEHEELQLIALSRAIIAGMDADTLEDEIRRRFGPWPRAARDDGNRVIWTRRELAEMEERLANLVKKDETTVVR